MTLALISFAGVMLWQQNQARLAEAERSESMSRFMLDLFDSVTPDARQGEAFTVAQLLEIGSERATRVFANDPASLHQVLLKISRTQLTLHQLDAVTANLETLQSLAGGER